MATAVDAEVVWAALPPPWRVAFEEAWTSWRAGNFGIGAVLVDPSDGAVVATGRNRVAEAPAEPGVLGGNMTAHAEMNAFAALDRFDASGLHLYATLEPCLMCAATAMQLKVAVVHVAAHDEFYDGLAELWSSHPLTAARQPRRLGPFRGDMARLGAMARLLPLSFTLERFPGRTAQRRARERHPGLVRLIEDLAADGGLEELRRTETFPEVLASLWDRLPAV